MAAMDRLAGTIQRMYESPLGFAMYTTKVLTPAVLLLALSVVIAGFVFQNADPKTHPEDKVKGDMFVATGMSIGVVGIAMSLYAKML